MPELADISYSRDDCVAAVRDYYQFLTQIYLPACQIIEPPEEGWPSIVNADPRLLKSLGKTDEVISLLAHLPYLRHTGNYSDDAHGAGECVLADWRRNFTNVDNQAKRMRGLTEKHLVDDIPPHVIGLCQGDRENPVFMLDTELGIVHWSECPDSVTNHPTREGILDDPCDYAPEEEWDWRCDCPAWAIADFFELLKDRFRQLNWIPISPRYVLDTEYYIGMEDRSPMPMLADIYRAHGWPVLENYRKDECLAAVRKALEEGYPDVIDERKGCKCPDPNACQGPVRTI